ncbi:MAG: metallophosphoesterase [Rubellimicrobium sp.]|nr:metallophosphoesterase [Rubellimicrobium sp.]
MPALLPAFLARLFRRAPPLAAPDPGQVVSVVGDVHGALEKLDSLLPRLPGQVILLGDLIDRGDHSAAVLDLAAGAGIVTLMGNHEAMLLGFLDAPEAEGPRWLRNGGLQTLASLDVRGDLSPAGLPVLRDRLALALGEDRIAWLRARPRFWHGGNVLVAHAGADPALPPEMQDDALIWGHPDCGRKARRDGLWVVQGHVTVPEPRIARGVIMVDTGAWSGGPLTAVVLGDGAPRFEQV